jgi:hypothetical protein
VEEMSFRHILDPRSSIMILGVWVVFRARARTGWCETKVRMMAMFTSTARSDRSTLESMATPCSVKA